MIDEEEEEDDDKVGLGKIKNKRMKIRVMKPG
jgi:hypothetical protein